MVFFICDVCQETLRKNKVESHMYSCKGCRAVSCVDCGVVFSRSSFESHNKCISEAEKYQGNIYQAKEEWINQLNDAADNVLDTNVKNALSILLQYSNVPRKKKQFNNFVRNSCHISDQLIENVWNILEETKNKLSLKKNEMIEAKKRSKTEIPEERYLIERTNRATKKIRKEFDVEKYIVKYLKKKPLKKSNLLKKIKEKADSYDTEKLEADFERIISNRDKYRQDTILELIE